MTIGVIGLGLIGGSIAIDVKKSGFAAKVLGCDANRLHAETARKLGIVDEVVDLDGIYAADLIVLAIPVSACISMLPGMLDKIDRQVITDVGSTKGSLCDAVRNHPNRARYVTAHPMAGTEFSGPWAAKSGLFDACAVIICDKEDSAPDALEMAVSMFGSVNMRPVYMDSKEHDMHAAYVSHISHISSFALALTTLEKEEDARNIFDLASGGFSSTVRLAKSSKEMWSPIFLDNKQNLLTVLDTYMDKVMAFRNAIENSDGEALDGLIGDANRIRKVLLR